jgi:PAS domain S-box-containing protein
MERFRTLADAMPQQVWTADPDGSLDYVNQRVLDYFGRSFDQMIGWGWEQVLHPDDLPECRVRWTHALETGEPYEIEFRLLRASDGSHRWHLGRALPLRDQAGRIVKWFGSNTDITDRKRLEEELRQAQKMEAVGRLVGGIAHDFNNLLTIIGGYSDILLCKLASRDPLGQYVRDIKKASGRAASLTRQLLAFSRRQVLEPKVLSLNDSILAMDRMLRRLIGEHIELTLALSPNLGPVMADPGQIEQVIMNLALNARDAMPDGGRLTITTANAAFDQADVGKPPGLPPGAYAQLIVADTGQGMDKATLAHLFEPFFTTKGVGKGIGLGLATVYGIAAQSNGAIWAASEPGQGATFTVCLPQTTQEVAQTTEPSVLLEATPRLPRGSKTILLAEDEDAVRALTRDVLEEEGYQVLEARNGVEALTLAAQHTGPIHLLLTDVVMPQMGGQALADRLAADRPGIKVLYMSGYIEDPNLQRGILYAQAAFLPKPALPELLLRKVLAVLDASD